jgi:hypothetical protein
LRRLWIPPDSLFTRLSLSLPHSEEKKTSVGVCVSAATGNIVFCSEILILGTQREAHKKTKINKIKMKEKGENEKVPTDTTRH